MITDNDIKQLRLSIENELSLEAEARFKQWRTNLESSFIGINEFPELLKDRMTIFIEENRVAFYVGFKEKMRERVKESIRNKPSLTIQKTIPRKLSGESWSCHKDRVYLEAFFTTKGVQRKAAESLGIGKSTYNDWVQTNLELIKSEAAKTGLKLDLRTERAEA